MQGPVQYDAHSKTTNWSVRKFFGDYPLIRAPAISLVENVWYPIIQIHPVDGLTSAVITTGANLTDGVAEFALATGRTIPNQAPFALKNILVPTVLKDHALTTALTQDLILFGAMFTTAKPDEYTWEELIDSLKAGVNSTFTKEDWSMLYLIFRITGTAVPETFYTRFITQNYGKTGR